MTTAHIYFLGASIGCFMGSVVSLAQMTLFLNLSKSVIKETFPKLSHEVFAIGLGIVLSLAIHILIGILMWGYAFLLNKLPKIKASVGGLIIRAIAIWVFAVSAAYGGIAFDHEMPTVMYFLCLECGVLFGRIYYLIEDDLSLLDAIAAVALSTVVRLQDRTLRLSILVAAPAALKELIIPLLKDDIERGQVPTVGNDDGNDDIPPLEDVESPVTHEEGGSQGDVGGAGRPGDTEGDDTEDGGGSEEDEEFFDSLEEIIEENDESGDDVPENEGILLPPPMPLSAVLPDGRLADIEQGGGLIERMLIESEARGEIVENLPPQNDQPVVAEGLHVEQSGGGGAIEPTGGGEGTEQSRGGGGTEQSGGRGSTGHVGDPQRNGGNCCVIF